MSKESVQRAIISFHKKNDPVLRTKRRKRSQPVPGAAPKENWEHERLVSHLRNQGVYFIHVPNEGVRSKWQGRYMFDSLGALKGAADIHVFDHLPNYPTARGLAIELKRVKGSSPAWGTTHQHEHLNALALRGWKAYVCRGHLAALQVLHLCGLMNQATPGCEKLIKEFDGGNEDGRFI